MHTELDHFIASLSARRRRSRRSLTAGRIVRAMSRLLETREGAAKRYQEQQAKADAAAALIPMTPIREIEERLGLHEYEYPLGHYGYVVHPRNDRPRSRREEERRFTRAEERLDRRLRQAGYTIPDASEEPSRTSA